MSKSIDQVWREMQQRRQAEMQRQILLEKQEQEKRERARQEYLAKMRMFEVNTSVASSAAAAGAAGAGGAGGAGGARKRAQVVSASNQQAVLYYDNNNDGFKYFIYNFENNNLTSLLSLQESTSTLFQVVPVTNGGYLFRFNDGVYNKLYFVDLNGTVIWEDFNNDGEHVDIEAFSRYVAPYYYKDGVYKLVMIDNTNTIKTFEFSNFIEGGGYSYDDVWKNGIVVREDVDSLRKYHLVNFDEQTTNQFLVIDIDLGDNLNVYQYAFSEKIFTIRNNSILEMWDRTGQKITEFDAETEFSTSNWSYIDFTFLDANGSCLLIGVDDDNSERNIIFFSGVSDTFSSQSFPSSYSYTSDLGTQKNYRFPSSYLAEGAALIYFRDTTNNINCDWFEYNTYSAILPIWSTDESLRQAFTFSTEMGLKTNLDTDVCCLVRNSDYIVTMVDQQPSGIYYFSDRENDYSNSISDGGFDMYDDGNEIYADDVTVSYTHTPLNQDRDQGMVVDEFNMDGQVSMDAVFGTSSSEYFTNLYPGLFVMCARNTTVDRFKIDGNTGADNLGDLDNFNFEVATNSNTYQVFVKQTFNIKEPSINHIIIVNAATSSGITHSIGASTDDDLDSLEGLSAAGVTEISYLLMSQFAGIKIELSDLQSIVTEFLNIRENSATINDLLTNLNSDYTNITNVLPSRGYIKLMRFNRVGDEYTILASNYERNLFDDDRFGEKSLLEFKNFKNLPGKSGWDILNDFEERKFSTFKAANRNQIGNYVLGQQFVMKDVVNNQYWGIQFTDWQQNNNGGAFAYTRQLIENGSFTGSVIAFTHSNYGNEIDVISEGILEITRNINGPIYNSATESESNGFGPDGTLWNAEGVYVYSESTHEIISRDGTPINSVTTEQFVNNWVGNVYCLLDESTGINYVSNLSNGGQLTNSFEGYFANNDSANSTSNESGLNPNIFTVFTDKDTFRILTSTSVSTEIQISVSLEFGKIDNVYICESGLLVVTSDITGYSFYFYNLNGELVFSKVDLNLSDPYEVTSYGTRLSVEYPVDGTLRYMFFNGTLVTEYTTGLTYYFFELSNNYLAYLP